jgi:hypothetical protein
VRAAADDHHRGGIGTRRSGADQDPGDDQDGQVGAQAADHAADQHQDDPDQENPAGAELLSELAGGRLRDRAGQVQRGDQDRRAPDRDVQGGGDWHERGRDH